MLIIAFKQIHLNRVPASLVFSFVCTSAKKAAPIENQWEPQPFDLLKIYFDYLLMSIPKYDFSIPNIAVKKFTKYIAKVMASPSGRFESVDSPGSVFIIA